MLTIRIKDHHVFAAAFEPVTQPGLDRFTFAPILRMNDKVDSGGLRSLCGSVPRSVINHQNMLELRARSLRHFADVPFLLICRNDRCNPRPVHSHIHFTRDTMEGHALSCPKTFWAVRAGLAITARRSPR